MPFNANIYYRYSQEGDGETPPVVLIHGAGGTHMHWPAQVRRLPGYRIYALDLPGHGQSEGRGYQTIEAYCQNIIEWLESIDIFRAVFVGHSMGGAIALTLALDYPEHVIALGLVGTGARLRVAPLILENAANPTTFPVAVNAIIERAFSPDTDPRLIELATQRMQTTRPAVLHGDFVACNAFDEMESVHKIRFPSIVICGQDDQLTPVRYAQFLADQIPNAEIKILPNAGHMVMLEQPDATAEAIANFLGKLTYSPGYGNTEHSE
jgi:pimeloyl-ACP methyl ester carboxylesterase